MVQFLAIGLLFFVTVALIGNRLIDQAAERDALANARRITAVLGHAVAERSLTDGLVSGDAGSIDRFDRAVGQGLLIDEVLRINIWDAEGTIIYSDQTELITQNFGGLEEDQLEILEHGGTDAELADPAGPESQFDEPIDELVEVYTRIETPDGVPLIFEVYVAGEDIAADTEAVLVPYRRIMFGSLALLGALATLIIFGLTRRLSRAAAERQRLLEAAIDASEAERRRIARDLHDGVVQDLAGTAFALSAAGREEGPPARETVTDSAVALRRSLRALRSLLVEIHPPDLDADGLPAALGDLVAPAATAGLEAHVDVSGVGGASDRVVALVWRVAQEGVRNAIRHSHGTRLDVVVRGEGERIVLEVSDDGVGIADADTRRPGHLGLRGMASLITEEGGQLTVTGGTGDGTTLRLEVAR